MSVRWLQDALSASGLDKPDSFPRNLEAEVAMALPLTVVPLEGLTTSSVDEWLRRRGVRHQLGGTPRALHGCLVARSGTAVVFIDAEDSEDERRFTLAHEVAHFVLDHVMPRSAALRAFGEVILPALDGRRPLSEAEQLSALLRGTPLRTEGKLMERNARGSICSWATEVAEQRADRLALEILAPFSEVLRSLRGLEEEDQRGEPGIQLLTEKFGIPPNAARVRVQQVLGVRPKERPSLLKLIDPG